MKRLPLWRYQPLGLALLAGLTMGLAPAPNNAWFLAWIALVPLWTLLIRSDPAIPYRRAAQLGLAWGLGYHGLALFWITGVHPMTWMGVPWLASLAIALFCWVFITLWGAALVTLWALGLTWVTRQSRPLWVTVLAGVALWCSLEQFWSLGSLWWTVLGYTQSPFNLAILHLGQISGPLTVSAAIVAVNGLLAVAWTRWQAKSLTAQPWFAAALIGLVGLHLIGWGLASRPFPTQPETALKVGIIQGNIPNSIKLYPEGWRRAIEGYTTGYRTLADQGVQVVLTPETALPFLWQDWHQGAPSSTNRPSFYQAILEKGVPAWIGALGQQERSVTNSLFTVAGNGEIVSRYNKVKLVPLGEYIPFEDVLGQVINRLSPLDAHMVAGNPDQQLQTPFGPAIVSICYESAFADHLRSQAARGGEFFLSSANNAHYSAAMPAQHHAQDVMRAIELDRWAVRATNTGYSGIVDPHGKTVWISGLNTYELHTATIYRQTSQTPYVRWGNWLTLLLLLLTGLAFGVTRRTPPSG